MNSPAEKLSNYLWRIKENKREHIELQGEGKDLLLPMNVGETSTAWLIQLALPGYKKDCLKMKVENGLLFITGGINNLSIPGTWKYSKKEIFTKPFSRSLLLPTNADVKKITVTFIDGLLSIILPKIKQNKL